MYGLQQGGKSEVMEKIRAGRSSGYSPIVESWQNMETRLILDNIAKTSYILSTYVFVTPLFLYTVTYSYFSCVKQNEQHHFHRAALGNTGAAQSVINCLK